jgi:hypothetical protein
VSLSSFLRRQARQSQGRAHARRRGVRPRLEVLDVRCLLSMIMVTTTGDNGNNTNPTSGSLRAAILESNQGTQTSTIDFDIPTSDSGYKAATGVWTVTLLTALPTISTNAAIIDGYSQTNASENNLAQGDNAKLTIAIDGAGQFDGLTIAEPGSQVFGLDIENFGGSGVVITAAGNVQVAGCFIGTDPTGKNLAPNANGVTIENSSNLIGGPLVGNRNVISGNTDYGIKIPDQSLNPISILPIQNVVENSYIGINAAGTTALPNGLVGIHDEGSQNTFGGTTSSLGNVISGNTEGGIQSTGSVNIEWNYIGTDATGNVAVPDGAGSGGISAEGFPSNATVTTTITHNVVSGNAGVGIDVTVGDQATSTYTISNNFVGTNAAGTAALGNGASGIQLESLENVTADNNVISANKIFGLEYSGFGTDLENNVFQGNKIGTDITGLIQLPNLDGGVQLSTAIGVTFGGPGAEGNVVAFNDGIGVDVEGQNPTLSKQVEITQNSIFDNTGLGIYLGINNVNNNFQMPPVLTWAPIGSGTTGTLTATLASNSIANKSYAIEIFSNPTVPGQGETYVTTLMVTADGSGKGSVSTVLPTEVYTATATELFTSPDEPGNTSQFALPPTVTTGSSSLNPSAVGQLVTFTAVVTVPGSTDPATGTVSFKVDGTTQFPAVPLTVVAGVDQAQFSTSSLSVGPHTIVATYGGDSSREPSTVTLPTQTVTLAGLTNTSTAVTSSLNPSTFGQSVTFTADVTPSSGTGTPTGTVTFSIDGQAQTPVSLAVAGSNDQAQFSTSSLSSGPHTISAMYNGNASFNPSTGNLPTQTVSAALTTTETNVSSTLNPSLVGQAVTFTAIVTASGSQATPTGTVTFTIDGQSQAPVPLALVGSDVEAQFSTSTLTAGQHSVSAKYNGDSVFATSTGGLPTQTVKPAPLIATSTGLSTSPNPSTFGQQVVLTATVTATDNGSMGGIVTFLDGTTVLGTGNVGQNGTATFDDTSLPVGSNVITADYSGDTLHVPSTSSAVAQVVQPPSIVAPTVASLARYGYHMQKTTLVLTFSTALDAASAENVREYQIVTLGGHGRGGTLVGNKTAVRKAIYNPSTLTVTLVPVRRLDIHNTYRLTVNGTAQTGVRSVSGLFLNDSATDSQGTNYEALITWRTLAGPAPGFAAKTLKTKAERAQKTGQPTKAGVDAVAAAGALATVADIKWNKSTTV